MSSAILAPTTCVRGIHQSSIADVCLRRRPKEPSVFAVELRSAFVAGDNPVFCCGSFQMLTTGKKHAHADLPLACSDGAWIYISRIHAHRFCYAGSISYESPPYASCTKSVQKGVVGISKLLNQKSGSPTWIRTTIHGSKGRCPTIRRSGNRAICARNAGLDG